jgi:hypothetical protein
VEQVEGVQGHPPAAAATVGQYPSEVVGEGSGGGIVETVDRDMDPGGPSRVATESASASTTWARRVTCSAWIVGCIQIVPSERAMGGGS